MERDAQFVYLALELCTAALHDVAEPLPGAAAPLIAGKPLLFLAPVDSTGKGAAACTKAGVAAGSGASSIGGGSPTLEPTALAWAVARDIGEGLAFLHTRGFVHRDLKPHNVLLAESGRLACCLCLSTASARPAGLCCIVRCSHQHLVWLPGCSYFQVRETRYAEAAFALDCRAKVSDMGLCTRLHNDASSFETPGAGDDLHRFQDQMPFRARACHTLNEMHASNGNQPGAYSPAAATASTGL